MDTPGKPIPPAAAFRSELTVNWYREAVPVLGSLRSGCKPMTFGSVELPEEVLQIGANPRLLVTN